MTNCGYAHETKDRQRRECKLRSCVPSDVNPLPKWIHGQPMRLLSCFPKLYLHTTGYRIEMAPLSHQPREEALPTDSFRPFVSVIFPMHVMHAKIPNLKPGNVYNVSGRRQGLVLQILDIC